MTDPRSLVLVVCTANVCRSPLGARVLQDAFRGAGWLRTVRVVSAGTRALEGAAMCEVSATLLPLADGGYAQTHAAEEVTPELVREADLVLTMEREQRSMIAQLAPGSQAKVFTVREVEGLLEVLAGRGGAVVEDLPSLARALHSVRGLAPVPAPEATRRWWQRRVEPADPLTIVDGHGRDRAEHLAAVQQVRATTERVAESVRRLTSAR